MTVIASLRRITTILLTTFFAAALIPAHAQSSKEIADIIATLPADDSKAPEGPAMTIIDVSGKEQKIKTWTFTQGTRRLGWLAERMREFVDVAPEFEAAVDRLATWLARLDDDED